MTEYSKLQIRAKVLAAISELRCVASDNNEKIKEIAEELKDIADKKFLVDIMIKELIKYDDPFIFVLSSVICAVADKDTIVGSVTQILTSRQYSDEVKYKTVQLLRNVSAKLSYENIIANFDNPTEILNADTEKMLQKALVNPEAQIDFLDFLSSLSNKDREILLSSFCEEYDNNNLANILSSAVYSKFDENTYYCITGLLGDTKSDFAVEPIQYIVNTNKNEKIVALAKKGLAKLKLAGATLENAEEKYKKYLKPLKIEKCFASLPDGNGNQGLIFTRLKPNGHYIFITFVVNDKFGAIDSFGFFDISEQEQTRIVERFFKDETKIQVSPNYIKLLVDNAFQKHYESLVPMPYEFVAWAGQLRDVLPLSINIKSAVLSEISPKKLSTDELIDVLNEKYCKKWFLTTEDNENFKKLIDLCGNDVTLNFEAVEKLYKENFEKIWNSEEINSWEERIYNTVYLLLYNRKITEAENVLALLADEVSISLFKEILLKKSILFSFSNMLKRKREVKEVKNIFVKTQTTTFISEEKLQDLIDKLQTEWEF